MKKKSKILTGASVAIISFAQIPFTAFADDTPTKYQIWIGSTQVTSENKNDILSDGGSVKFDPEIHLLTFDNPKEIKGETYDVSWWSAILAKESVTMTGTLNMSKNSNKSDELAIWCQGENLILDNFNLSVTDYGYGIVSFGKNITIQNGSDIKVNDISCNTNSYSYSIGTAGTIVIENSRVTVDNCYSGIGGNNTKSLTIKGNNTYVKASNIKNGKPIRTECLTLGDEVQLIKDEANGIYTVKSKNYAQTRTYPTNIKFEYNEKYHQGRFTWDRVKNADRYSVAIYSAGKWKLQTQNITTNSYITPKTLKPGATYRVAIAARVNGKWDTANAIRHAVTITIPADSPDTDGDGILNTTAMVTSDGVSVRKGPGTDYDLLEDMYRNYRMDGEIVRVYEVDDSGTWAKIRLPENHNEYGWISTTYLEEKSESDDFNSVISQDYKNNVYNVTLDDYILICNAVGNESGLDTMCVNEKATVAAVIMNRVFSNSFPDTIREVIEQGNAFENSNDYNTETLYFEKVNEDVLEAVEQYFQNPDNYSNYLYFLGDGTHNYFSINYPTGGNSLTYECPTDSGMLYRDVSVDSNGVQYFN